MKIVLIISVIAGVQGLVQYNEPSPNEINKTEEYTRSLKKHQMDCIELTKVDTSLVMKLKAGVWNITEKPLKLWTLCVLNKMGLMSTEGVFRLDEALATIPYKYKDTAEKIIDKCLYQKEAPPQEIAWSYVKCHHKMDKHHNFTTLTILEPGLS